MTFDPASFLTPLAAVFQPQERLYWNYLLMAYALGAVIVWLMRRETQTLRSTLSHLFPSAVWWQRSVIHDVGFSYLMLLLQYGAIGTLTAVIGEKMAELFIRLDVPVTSGWVPLHAGYLVTTLVTTLAITAALDFSLYLAHWLLHRVPWLWPFHAVHHSAESLTPFTGYRQHPIDTLVNTVVSGIVVGSALGFIRILFGPEIQFIGIGGQSVVILIFYLFGYHLRHTHIWVDYGPRLSQFLISPAQHQIHHSLDPRHHDKNLGYMLAVWDLIFGTLYIPRKREQLIFGLKESFLGYQPSFLALLYKPFQEVICQHRATLVLLGLATLLLLPWLGHYPIPDSQTSRMSVELSELTSPEVGKLIQEGYVTVIVPTGGTEQNGPHMVLGKHNAIIRRNAIEVARRMGNTLVAPVMAYVPEGDITSKEGHMAYPGTLSVRSTTFQSLLSDTAMSLKAHGFKKIVFMGDSGGNQTDQEDIARYLSACWQSDGIKVIALSDYYNRNHQADYLAMLGYSLASIGHHGGIRDTSELLFIHPEGIRNQLLKDRSQTTGIGSGGSDGNSLLASPELGASLTRLKIEAALNALSTPEIMNRNSNSKRHAFAPEAIAPLHALRTKSPRDHPEEIE